jgi:membrane protease YdiL (CAAX protease family)
VLLDKFSLAALSLILAAALWILTFLIRPIEFWFSLAISTLLLMIASLSINRNVAAGIDLRMISYGVLSSVLLYAFFYAGFQITRTIPILSEGVRRVYEFRSLVAVPMIGLLLIFPIGPGEEIYWRGLIQRRFSERFGPNTGFLAATTAYALVHLPTLNGPLIMTAFIGGLVWGYLYKKTGNLVPAIISHVLWDLLIFVIAPLN